ncbi:hypothetical protein PSACC_03522, partial [Paramicrosporidium saccamoebae]
KKDHLLKRQLNSIRGDEQHNALDFSKLQVDALVKRRRLAEQLEKVQDSSSMDFEGDYIGKLEGKRIASDGGKRYVLLKNSLSEGGGWTIDGTAKDDEVQVATKKETPAENDNFEAFFGTLDEKYDVIDLVEPGMNDPVVSSFVQQNRSKDEEQPTNLSFDPIEYIAKPLKEEMIFSPLQVITIEDEDSSDTVKPTPERLLVDSSDIVESAPEQLSEDSSDIVELDSKQSSDDALPKIGEKATDQILQEFEEPVDLALEDDVIVEELIPPTYANRDNSELIEQLQSEISALKDSAQPASSSSPDSELLAEFRTMLTIMGIPWINAPGEAEAQCAHLQVIGHVDGVITDDNDVLLFGATKVYRHFFNNSKRIMRFGVKEIERDLALGRSELAILAVMLGGDYGTGVRGMGPVKSMQLLKILRPVVETGEMLAIIAAGLVDSVWPTVDAGSSAFLKKLSIQCAVSDRRLFDPAIVDAYFNPLVDETSSRFQWSLLPDITRLTEFLQTKLRWDPSEVKRTIDPIIMRRTRKK